MQIAHVLGALAFVFGSAIVLMALFVGVRWVILRFPLPAGTGETVSAGPFGSVPGQVPEALSDLRQRMLEMESDHRLLRNEWEETRKALMRERERVRKASQRSREDEPELSLEDLRAMEAPALPDVPRLVTRPAGDDPRQLVAIPQAPVDGKLRRFLEKYPEGET